jgi:hypothetical protein
VTTRGVFALRPNILWSGHRIPKPEFTRVMSAAKTGAPTPQARFVRDPAELQTNGHVELYI